jgi:hypothetical protein
LPEDSDAEALPVYVIESIPVGGPNEIPAAEIKSEGIPTPAHLKLYPELGRGGMGRIHPATDRNLLRHVALKRLAKELVTESFYRDGFVAEAQITGQLEHPNIVPVHELALDEHGVPYFTMKLVQGQGFHQWLREPGRPPGTTARLEEGLEIFLKVCDAIAYAHHRGVIHRDLKPDNIIVAGFGQVYVMDWGLARLTRTRPAEQARGNPREMDERSDVFGLGAILYEIVSGFTPFGREIDADRIIELSRVGAVIPIEQQARGIGISKRLRNIVMKAVQPQPAERYQSVAELRDDVRTFLLGGLHLPRRAHAAGELIIREGEAGDAAYIIVSGQCRAFRQIGEQREPLQTMGPGDVFGEMALLLDEPRYASVEALEPVTLLVVDRATLTEGLGVEGWTGALVRALAERFRDLERTVRSSGLRRG